MGFVWIFLYFLGVDDLEGYAKLVAAAPTAALTAAAAMESKLSDLKLFGLSDAKETRLLAGAVISSSSSLERLINIYI